MGGFVLAQKKSKKDYRCMELEVMDTGTGFSEETKEKIKDLLLNYAKQAPKLEGNSIGILNVQKRIKLLCGRDYGLSYTDNKGGGVTAHLLLPISEEGWE